MADKGFEGSTVTFGGATVGTIRSISFSEDAGGANVTGSGDAVQTTVDGILDVEVTIQTVGAPTVAAGAAAAALAISWNDGTSDGDEAGTYRVSKRSVTGSMGQEITGSISFKPATVP